MSGLNIFVLCLYVLNIGFAVISSNWTAALGWTCATIEIISRSL